MEDDTAFDSEVKDAIDSALATATQLNREVGDPSSEAKITPLRLLARILHQYINFSVR